MTYLLSRYTGSAIGVRPLGVHLTDVLLAAFLVICAYTDGTRGKIYNKITFPAMLAGLLLNAEFGGLTGLGWAALGWTVGMAIQFVPFVLGLAKAGDVKMLAAVGALKGWAFCIFGFLYGAIAFAVLILPWLASRGELAAVGRNIAGYAATAALTQSAPDAPAPVVTKRFVPWGVGLAVGFLFALACELHYDRPFWF